MALIRAASALAVAGLAHTAVNALLLRRPATGGTPGTAVPVLVPARDEATTVGECVLSADGPVVVLDDGSTDGTAAAARAAGARVLTGTPPPPGWHGKAWACAQLAEAVDEPVLVFVDADVRLEPGAVAAAVGLLASSGLDVVCPFPRQVTVTPAERLVQPLLQWSWLCLLPLRLAERSPRPSLTAACGQFVVVRREALERAGGFAAVRGAVLDDLALVRAIKAAGGRGGVVDGTALASCRMYASWPQLRDGYAKSLWAAFGSPAGTLAVIAGLGFVYVLPPLAALAGSRAGAVGYAAAVASRAVAARRTGGRVADSVAHPVSVLTVSWISLYSQHARWRGTLRWKGRRV